MIYGYIYKITNIVNGKIYIGKTKYSIESRFRGHIKCAHREDTHSNTGSYLHKAINKYGEDNFIIEVLDIAESLSELNEKEKYWIFTLNSCDKFIGYNIAKGGDGGDIFNQLSFEQQEEKRKKHSFDTSNRMWITNGVDTKYVDKNSIIPLGYYPGRTMNTKNIGKYKRTEEHRQKLKGRKSPLRGKHLSEETKQKLREANLGKKYTDETNKKKGRPKSGELNPAYGTHYKWLTNGIEDIRIYESNYDNLDIYYSSGYVDGRSNKFLFKGK